MAGCLYLCATPIGNLEDITLRALRIMREVDVLVAEDSRRTRNLLTHYGITTPLAPSLYQGTEEERTRRILDLLREGKDVALVSDAGTPLISDPGFPLVLACIREGIPVVPIPGPSAVLAALVASGLPADRFLFAGYPPRKLSAREEWLSELMEYGCTVVIFEAPTRLLATLGMLSELDPSREVVVARELTKVHEEFVRGKAEDVFRELRNRANIKGEIVILLGPKPKAKVSCPASSEVRDLYEKLIASGLSPKEARKEVAQQLGIPRRVVYRALLENAG